MNQKTKYLKSKNKSGKGTETRGNKVKPQGKRTINRTGRGIGNRGGIEERNGNQGTERKQAEEQRKLSRRFFFGRAARTEQGGGWENKQGKKERTENKN